MRHHIARRIINLTFAFLLAVFSVNFSGVLALETAYAKDQGTYQPVWCKLTGNDWQAQLAANGNGKDGALLMTDAIRDLNLSNVDNTIQNGNQVYAHDRDDKLDAACDLQFTLPTPTPTVTGECGLDNDIVTVPDNANYTSSLSGWVASTRTVTLNAVSPYHFANDATSINLTVTEVNTETCPTPQPEDQVDYSDWTDSAYVCGDDTVTQTRTKTVTSYVWDGDEWVLDTQNAVVTTETQTREPSSDELKSCAVQPDDQVIYTEWTDGEFTCDNEVVDQTRTKTVTPYIWSGTEWVLDTANAVTTTETQTRPLTDEEAASCEEPCEPSVVALIDLQSVLTDDNCEPGRGNIGGEEPQDPPVVPTPPAKLTGVTLPETGVNPLQQLLTIIAAGIITYGATYFFVNRRDLARK